MEYDYRALDKKKIEIRELIRIRAAPYTQDPDLLSESLLKSFIRLTPPTKAESIIQMITVGQAGVGGGISRKPGNICLNMRKVMELVPDATIAAVGAATAPVWLLPFISLYIWNKLWRSSEETLTETEGTVIYSLWKHRNGDSTISEDIGFEKTNAERERARLQDLKRSEFDTCINRLVDMECIEIEEGIIWLRECVNVAY